MQREANDIGQRKKKTDKDRKPLQPRKHGDVKMLKEKKSVADEYAKLTKIKLQQTKTQHYLKKICSRRKGDIIEKISVADENDKLSKINLQLTKTRH